MKVKYIHASKSDLVSAKEIYELDYVRSLSEEFKNNYKIYFMPITGDWRKPKKEEVNE